MSRAEPRGEDRTRAEPPGREGGSRTVGGARSLRTVLWGSFLAIVALALGALIWMDQRSVERGNLAFRTGDLVRAERLYRANVDAGDEAPQTLYNLGTALLAGSSDEAEEWLQRAVREQDSAAAQRGHKNLGYLYLTRLDSAADVEITIATLTAVVAHERAALLLDPRDADALWNLALAQHVLDSLAPQLVGLLGFETQSEEASNFETTIDLPSNEPGGSQDGDTDEGRESDESRQGSGSGRRATTAGGEGEAGAGQDPGPLTEAQAVGLLDHVSDDPETLVRGLLWSLRPNEAWWESQPKPGGDW